MYITWAQSSSLLFHSPSMGMPRFCKSCTIAYTASALAVKLKIISQLYDHSIKSRPIMTLTLATCFSAIIIVEQLGFGIRGPGCLECNIFCNICVIGLSYYISELYILVVPTKLGRAGYQSLVLKCGVEDPSSAMAVVNWSEFFLACPKKNYPYIPSFTTSKGND
jgi:hypothetical protein